LADQVGVIDIEALQRDRNQLFAEAAALEATGESLFLDKALWEAAAKEQEDRRERDPWEDALAHYVGIRPYPNTQGAGCEYRVSNTELFEVLQISTINQSTALGRRLSGVMKKLGWRAGHKVSIDGKQHRGYSKQCPDTVVAPDIMVVTSNELKAMIQQGSGGALN
jgi:predicted P-loop ATPase